MEGAIAPGPGDRRRRRQPDHQRARGVHARTTSSSSARARSAASSSPPGSRAHGIAGAGGIGRQIASWIVDGEPELDLWKMDIRRFGASLPVAGVHAGPIDRELRHLLRHPLPERGAPGGPAAADRRRRTSALAALGAVVRREVRLGAPELVRAQRGRPAVRRAGGARGAPAARLGRPATGRPAIAAEALATRQAAAVFDESSVRQARGRAGRARCAFLQSVAGNDIDRAVGSIVYTQLLDPRGGIEADLTVTRLADGPVPARHRHGVRQPRRRLAPAQLPDDAADGRGRDPGPDLGPGLLRRCGGRARGTSSPALTPDDLSDAGFPYLTAREISLGPCRCWRCGSPTSASSAGSCYAPTEYGRALWDTIWDAGREHGLVAGGYRAIDALRLEKGYRVWSTRHHAGRDAVRGGPRVRGRARQGADFIGRDALVAAKAAGPRKRLRCLVLDDPRSVALGNEPVRVDGEIVGRVTSGGYGFAVERSIAYAYLPPDRADRDPRRGRACSASGSASRSCASRCTTRRTRGSARERAAGSAELGPRLVGGAPPRRRTRSCAAGSRSPRPPATRPTPSPCGISGAT